MPKIDKKQHEAPAIAAITLLLSVLCIAQDLPIDKKATKETANLYRNLKKQFRKESSLAIRMTWLMALIGNMKRVGVI
jgi:hypothetical protein